MLWAIMEPMGLYPVWSSTNRAATYRVFNHTYYDLVRCEVVKFIEVPRRKAKAKAKARKARRKK